MAAPKSVHLYMTVYTAACTIIYSRQSSIQGCLWMWIRRVCITAAHINLEYHTIRLHYSIYVCTYTLPTLYAPAYTLPYTYIYAPIYVHTDWRVWYIYAPIYVHTDWHVWYIYAPIYVHTDWRVFYIYAPI